MVYVTLPRPGREVTRNLWGGQINAAVEELSAALHQLGAVSAAPVLPEPLDPSTENAWWPPLKVALQSLKDRCAFLGAPVTAPLPAEDVATWPSELNAFLQDVCDQVTEAEARPNLITNFSFETNVAGWAGSTVFGAWDLTPAPVSSTDRATLGVRSMRIDWGTGELAKPGGMLINAGGMVAGQPYVFSADVWVTAGSPAVKPDALFMPQSDRVDSGPAGAWKRVRVKTVPNATTAFFGVTTTTARTGASDRAYVDNVRLIRAF